MIRPELVLKPMRPLGGDWPRELAACAEVADRCDMERVAV